MKRRRIVAVTSSRADFSLLFWPMRLLRESDKFDLQVVVTGTHLAEEFGYTVREVEKSFPIAARVPTLQHEGRWSKRGQNFWKRCYRFC